MDSAAAPGTLNIPQIVRRTPLVRLPFYRHLRIYETRFAVKHAYARPPIG